MRNYFARIKLLYLKKQKDATPEIREKRQAGAYIQFRVAKRNRRCVCASEANSQLSCALEAMNAATEVDILTRDLVVIIVF